MEDILQSCGHGWNQHWAKKCLKAVAMRIPRTRTLAAGCFLFTLYLGHQHGGINEYKWTNSVNMIFRARFLFTESFLKNGNYKEDKRRNGDEREGRKRERRRRENEGQSRKSHQPVVFRVLALSGKKSGVVFCAGLWHHYLTSVLDSNEQGSREKAPAMLSPSNVTVREQVLVFLVPQILESPCQPMSRCSWTVAVASVKALHLDSENLVLKTWWPGPADSLPMVLKSFISFLLSWPLLLYFHIPSFCPLSNQTL